ncbi:MAG: transposase, partial [Candidatus Methanomethyliaceae archaeon]
IKKHVDFSFVEEETARYYHLGLGRPSFPPEVLFMVLFLEVWANLSDVQVCREPRYNVLYRYFCGIGWDDPVPDDTTLVVFRERLGEEGFRRLFERVVEQAKQNGLLLSKWAIIDGTKVIAYAAVKSHLSLVREDRKKLVQVLARHDEAAAQELAALAESERDTDYADHKALLMAEIAKGRELLLRLEPYQHQDLLELKELYRKAVELEVDSLSDPDARWGFKKKDKPFLGYKAHVACDETGIVTAVEVTPGNEAELPQAEVLVGELKKQGLKPRYLAADKAYDAPYLRAELALHTCSCGSKMAGPAGFYLPCQDRHPDLFSGQKGYW